MKRLLSGGSSFVLRCLLYVLVYSAVQRIMPVPYIDEEAHVPQAMAYCRGEWNRWDPKITTPPGLYLGSWLLLQPVRFFYWLSGQNGQNDYCIEASSSSRSIDCAATPLWCSLGWLRATQLVYVAGLERIGGSGWPVMAPFVIPMVPLLVPSLFLYYTDVGSLFWVLLMRRLRHHSGILGAGCGMIALMYRQTNLAWILLTGGEVALEAANASLEEDASSGLIIKTVARLLHRFPNRVFPAVWPFILVVCTFLAFLWLNNGAAMGDRDAHQMALHLPQLFYTAVAVSAMVLPLLLPTKPRMLKPMPFLVLVALHLVGIHYCTIEHPYLLSDPRHIAVALWRRLMRGAWWMRYAYAPVYVFLEMALLQGLLPALGSLRTLVLIVTTALAVVPSPLVEPRYFLIPTILVLEALLTRKRSLSSAITLYHAVWMVILGSLFFLTKTHFIW